MTKREKELVALMIADRAYCDRAKLAGEEAVDPIAAGFTLRSCGHCGSQFMPPHRASRYCSHRCVANHELRKQKEHRENEKCKSSHAPSRGFVD